ncbi:MAG: hypothetical protein ACM30H_05780 [Clostridia bacterium]
MSEEQELQLELEAERRRAEAAWKGGASEYVALPVAAAIAFHQAHHATRTIVSRHDYDEALNMAASALSRLIPIYRLAGPALGREVVAVDLVRQRFARGATRLRSADGSETSDELSVMRGNLQLALDEIRRVGVPFSLAFGPEREP